jgi:hypothetical protein
MYAASSLTSERLECPSRRIGLARRWQVLREVCAGDSVLQVLGPCFELRRGAMASLNPPQQPSPRTQIPWHEASARRAEPRLRRESRGRIRRRVAFGRRTQPYEVALSQRRLHLGSAPQCVASKALRVQQLRRRLRRSLRWAFCVTPNVRVEAGPTVLRLAREAHPLPRRLAGQVQCRWASPPTTVRPRCSRAKDSSARGLRTPALAERYGRRGCAMVLADFTTYAARNDVFVWRRRRAPSVEPAT